MKNHIIILLLTGFLVFACNEKFLNLTPLSEGSSENWYQSDEEIIMAINYLYSNKFIRTNPETYGTARRKYVDSWTDDWTNRASLTEVTNGTINGQVNYVVEWWKLFYECIAAANLVLEKIDNGVASNIAENNLNKYKGAARFARAYMYARLITLWGDVPFFTKTLSIEEAFNLSRESKNIILQSVYDDYDFAAANLPISYGTQEPQWATKGAALAMKARIALYMEDWEIARDAAKACIDLGIYDLYTDFSALFFPETKNPKEAIFLSPRSLDPQQWDKGTLQEFCTRTPGGGAFHQPSWDLFCSFLCSDGMPIDESPLYNPQKPFQNRDPRCTATIVEFGTPHLFYIYQPHPDSLVTMNYTTGLYHTNNDSRGVIQWASFNGIMRKKGVTEDWVDDWKTDPDDIIIRYADVLLIFAEAKIELGQIDQTVLNAVNMVRSRAYGVDYSQTSDYPAITTTDPLQLRKLLRVERRMEFAFEGLRYYDIIRWKLAEKVLNTSIYGMLDPAELRQKVIQPGLWFFPDAPPIDEDGIPDFQPMFNTGLIKKIVTRSFDKAKQYLWPIPSKEIIINDNLTQNPGY
jgi:hypothetical protein